MTTTQPYATDVDRDRTVVPTVDREGLRTRRLPETKWFLLSSEFWTAAGAVVALFIGAYALEDFTRELAWQLSTLVAIAYIVSRGIAKAASSREYEIDPRDRMAPPRA
jgi:hypothetical protein